LSSPLSVRSLLWTAALAALLVGCAGSKEPVAPGLPEGFPNHSATQIQQRIQMSADTLTSFRANARATVRSPAQNGTFNTEVRHVRDDSLYMNFRLFGIEGARLLVSRDSFFFYDRRENRMVVGSRAQAERLFPAPLARGSIFKNLLGFLAPPSTSGWTVTHDSSRYYVKDPTGQRTYTVDPTRWRVVRYAVTDDTGSTLEERLFTDFTTIDGVLLPTRVIFRRPADEMMVMMRYGSLRLNPASLSFDLDVNGDVPRVTPSFAR
jgi:outer membrane lipoprotein-sorting protein